MCPTHAHFPPVEPEPPAVVHPRGRRRLRAESFKPASYALMHLCVAVAVAYVLTRDWRIALGVGIIEPIVQTVAYMMHEHLWSRRARRNAALPA
jgi:uncharacterized membrane protein